MTKIEMRYHKVNDVELRQAYCLCEQKWQSSGECNWNNCGYIQHGSVSRMEFGAAIRRHLAR